MLRLASHAHAVSVTSISMRCDGASIHLQRESGILRLTNKTSTYRFCLFVLGYFDFTQSSTNFPNFLKRKTLESLKMLPISDEK